MPLLYAAKEAPNSNANKAAAGNSRFMSRDTNRQNGALRLSNDAFGSTSNKNACNAAVAMCRHNDHRRLDLVGIAGDFIGRPTQEGL
jgi:hypothetical protein